MMHSYFGQKYKLISSVNFDEFMKALGNKTFLLVGIL